MFQLHPRLAADTHPVARLELCELRLMDDRRFLWLVLIPQREGVTEVHALSARDQRLLIQESSQVARHLTELCQPVKINVGALGNLVSQLHWHVVARHSSDPCWPGPVWGCGQTIPYAEEERRLLIQEVADLVCRAGAATTLSQGTEPLSQDQS